MVDTHDRDLPQVVVRSDLEAPDPAPDWANHVWRALVRQSARQLAYEAGIRASVDSLTRTSRRLARTTPPTGGDDGRRAIPHGLQPPPEAALSEIPVKFWDFGWLSPYQASVPDRFREVRRARRTDKKWFWS